LSGDRRRRVGSKLFSVCSPYKRRQGGSPGLLGASARMTWCARVFGALKVIRVPCNSAGARLLARTAPADPHGASSVAKNARRLSRVGSSRLLAADYFFLLDSLPILVEKSSFNPIFPIYYLETKRIFVLVVFHECSYLSLVILYL